MKRLILIALLAAALPAPAEQYGTGYVTIESAWARELPPVSENGAAYVTIVNEGDRPDRLTGASGDIAERVEVHTHEQAGGMMTMRRLDGVDLPPGEHVRFAPGGLHLMLIRPQAPRWRKADASPSAWSSPLPHPIEIEVPVRAMEATAMESHDHQSE